MTDAVEWVDITEQQPRQGQRILVRLRTGVTRICTYDRFQWECWDIVKYKVMPDAQRRSF